MAQWDNVSTMWQTMCYTHRIMELFEFTSAFKPNCKSKCISVLNSQHIQRNSGFKWWQRMVLIYSTFQSGILARNWTCLLYKGGSAMIHRSITKVILHNCVLSFLSVTKGNYIHLYCIYYPVRQGRWEESWKLCWPVTDRIKCKTTILV